MYLHKFLSNQSGKPTCKLSRRRSGWTAFSLVKFFRQCTPTSNWIPNTSYLCTIMLYLILECIHSTIMWITPGQRWCLALHITPPRIPTLSFISYKNHLAFLMISFLICKNGDKACLLDVYRYNTYMCVSCVQ